MGFGRKKRRTKVEKVNKKVTLSKIVKFTYLQTLAIDGGLTSVKDIAGETEAKEETAQNTDVNKSFVDKFLGGSNGDALNSMFLISDLPPGIGDLARSLFGKKITTDVKVNIKDSGWTLTKTWNQPQFDILRYSIGIKELTVAQFRYQEVSELISTPWKCPKEITKVFLTVDQFIPNTFPVGNYIKYYIKPNIENADWVQINPLGLPSVFNTDGSIVPRIINFNTEKPLSSRLEDSYVYTNSPVKEVVFRAVLSRPTELENSTASADGYSPILRSYRLSLVPKNGL